MLLFRHIQSGMKHALMSQVHSVKKAKCYAGWTLSRL